jgi:aspartyl-tRNA(Asn)/glutamyl-tRNA(Gln) amidotransferase subunit C
MPITIDEVRHIAFLARLALTPEEEQLYTEQLSAVLDHAARLAEVQTEHISPTASVLDLKAPLRPDVTRPCPPRAKILSNAPDSDEGMFRVPPVLE